MAEQSTTRTIVVNGRTRTLEERPDGDEVEVIERDESGAVVAWYRRKVAPHAPVPMVPDHSHTFRVGPPGVPEHCGTHECKAAQSDGVLCANGECDRENGVRPDGVTTRHPRCGYPYCACVGECFVASQPGGAAGVATDGGAKL